MAKPKVKLRAKKQFKGKPRKRGFPWFIWLAIGLGAVAIAAFTLNWQPDEPLRYTPSGELKAAIIDQLHNLQPNQAFIDRVTQELEDYGFTVDVYRGDVITVDFYRKLSAYGYKLIIFRVHSGLLEGSQAVANKTWLFTSEPYSRMRYFMEQLTGQVTRAATSQGGPPVFALSAKFIEKSVRRPFADTAIIMMGCSVLRFEDMAQAFVQKGASAYLGWDASVELSYVDAATATLIKNLSSKGLTISQAVAQTMKEEGPDPNWHAVLQYYPTGRADKPLRQLIEQKPSVEVD